MSANVIGELVQRAWTHSFFRFVIVGFTGFGVDALVLLALAHGLGATPVLARVVSFPTAVFCTWALNRLWSFAEHRSARVLPEAGRYVLVQLTGGSANFAVYAAVVWMVPGMRHAVLVPLAVGSAVGLGINYFGSRFLVFRGR